MINKIKGLLGSIRFWIYTFSATAGFLATIEQSGFSWEKLFTFMAAWLGVVGVTGGVDKWFAKK